MATYRDQGVVLRSYKLGETDRILHVLAADRGRIRAVAKGVRRPGSRFGGRLEPFSLVDLQLWEGRNLDVVQQVELVASHDRVRLDYERSTSASVMVELVDAVAQDGHRDAGLFLLLTAALGALDAEPPDPGLFLDAFLLRAADVVGAGVAIDACAVCRRPGEHPFVSIGRGGVLCSDDAPVGTRALPPATIGLLRLLADRREWAALATTDAPPDARRTAASFARAWVEHHLDRRLKGYDVVPRDHVAAAEAAAAYRA